MKKLMIAAAALLLSAPLFAQEKNFIDQPYLEVNGRAEMEVAPDEIYVRITINEQDSKGKVTVLQQEKDMVRRLKDLGIDVEKKLVVQDMSSDLFKRKDVSTSKTYQLEVNSATQLAHVFQALQAVGISDASIERTDVSNMDCASRYELRQPKPPSRMRRCLPPHSDKRPARRFSYRITVTAPALMPIS